MKRYKHEHYSIVENRRRMLGDPWHTAPGFLFDGFQLAPVKMTDRDFRRHKRFTSGALLNREHGRPRFAQICLAGEWSSARHTVGQARDNLRSYHRNVRLESMEDESQDEARGCELTDSYVYGGQHRRAARQV